MNTDHRHPLPFGVRILDPEIHGVKVTAIGCTGDKRSLGHMHLGWPLSAWGGQGKDPFTVPMRNGVSVTVAGDAKTKHRNSSLPPDSQAEQTVQKIQTLATAE